MIPSLLISFREILEAALIVATIIGILHKLGHASAVRTVWVAAGTAIGASVVFLLAASVMGLKIHQQFTGKTEELFEGTIMIISAFFITWAVFFLHKTFGHYKLSLLQKVRSTLQANEHRGIFFLVFTAVFREGFEIVLFLSTIFFSSRPVDILSGFALGSLVAICIALVLFTTSIRLPIFYTFRLTSILLILFAAGLLAHGFHELSEAQVFSVPTTHTLTFAFLPAKDSVLGSSIRSVFGLSQTMHIIEFSLWSAYVLIMTWIIILRPSLKARLNNTLTSS